MVTADQAFMLMPSDVNLVRVLAVYEMSHNSISLASFIGIATMYGVLCRDCFTKFYYR